LLARHIDLLIANQTKQSIVQAARVNVSKLLSEQEASLTFVFPICLEVLHQDILSLLIVFKSCGLQRLYHFFWVSSLLALNVMKEQSEETFLNHFTEGRMEAKV
jgi:hypothetical protein